MYRLLASGLVVVLGLVATKSLPALTSGPANASTITLQKRTQIPGETLKPGTYSIKVLDHLSDRMIVRVEDTAGKTHTVFLAVPNTSLSNKTTIGGAIAWKVDLNGSTALRGFKFPSGYTVEFVYPKAEAAALAKSNQGNVLAVDPESEGKPELRKMSSEDLQMIHLWMLSLTTAGPDSKTPAIQAQAYHPPATPAPVQVAQNSVPSAPQARSQNQSGGESISAPAPHLDPRRHRVIKVLPHTASYLPLIVLAAFGSLLVALLLHLGLSMGLRGSE